MAFANNKTLVEPFDVEYCTPAGQNFSSQHARTYIVQEEERLFNGSFGWDFYEILLGNKIAHDWSNFTDTKSYAVDDVVLWRNQLYKCIELTTNEPPSNGDKWELATVFSNENYDFLWFRYLKEIIAWSVLASTVLPTSVPLTNLGVQTKNGQTSQGAGLNKINALKEEYQADVIAKVKNMHAFISRNKSSFPSYGVTNGKSIKRRPRKRHNDGWNLGNTLKSCC